MIYYNNAICGMSGDVIAFYMSHREAGKYLKKAYDYSGAFGIINAKHKPNEESEIAKEYTCCTLVVAALKYAGYELHSTHRGGVLDIITPRQVVDSWGVVRE